ncbi:hypothetical protein BTT_10090 [Bacillus thuringiensis serovar morrisoni str. 4AA1]|nr:hypothetical protein IAW_03982 [Bacillus cereus str. Schrouff]EOO83548.1 hypothetical protein IGY_04599 [Bacillus cereus K-5975c]KIP28896.1 hypothetical protein BG10_3891 [Bacillus thuringiensis serovar morrisoni]UOB99833.1 hypothetical protein BTT_10090 [Bacillus thuringiensis serovar morrisoni str. 4AA1]SPT88542.1 Uncharacterised protein [Bacillus cereus]
MSTEEFLTDIHEHTPSYRQIKIEALRRFPNERLQVIEYI